MRSSAVLRVTWVHPPVSINMPPLSHGVERLEGSKKVCRGLLGALCCHHAASEGKRVLVLISAIVNSVD